MLNHVKYFAFVIIMFVSCNEGVSLKDGEVILDNLIIPWEIEIGPDKNLWFTHQISKVSKLNLKTNEVIELKLSNPNNLENTRYILGMTFHPNFKENPLVYLSFLYSSPNDSTTGVMDVEIYTYNNDTLTFKEQIVKSVGVRGSWNPGGRIKAKGNFLYIIASNESGSNVSQNNNDLSGSILRYNLDGSIPDDNPFPNSPIFSYGHRNPQGLIIKGNDDVYSTEHGPSTDDELNQIIKGGNYGWPLVHGFCDKEGERRICDSTIIIEPIIAWTPTIAVSSLDYYEGEVAEFKESFWVTTLKEGDLRMLKLNEYNEITQEHIFLNEKYGRLRDLAFDDEGNIYISTANQIPSSAVGYPKPNKDESLNYDVIVKVSLQ